MRALIMSAALILAASSAYAQAPLTAAKKAAQNAAAATDAHTEAMQKPEGAVKTVASAPAASQTKNAPAAPTKSAAAVTSKSKGAARPPAAKSQQPASGVERPGGQLDVPATDTVPTPPTILREAFDYEKEGRRDPFVSLLTTPELRPTMSDLRLTSIVMDLSGRNSLATLRDVSANTRYTVHVGSTLGRMRVSSIRGQTVVLTIDEFGTTRQDSLILRDSTRVRRP